MLPMQQAGASEPNMHHYVYLEKRSITDDEGTTFAVDHRYHIHKRVGRGSQGIIWSALDSSNDPPQREVAVRRVEHGMEQLAAAKRLLRELRLLKTVKHPNIIQLYDIMLPPSTNVLLWKHVYVVYELMPTDLEYLIRSGQTLTAAHARYFSAQLFSALAYLHRRSVMHRDIKPSNLLVSRDCRLKVCDFGLARPFASAEDQGQFYSSYANLVSWYRAPEVCAFARGTHSANRAAGPHAPAQLRMPTRTTAALCTNPSKLSKLPH